MTEQTLEHDESQERAIDLLIGRNSGAHVQRLGVITGGPGVGKTTCLKRALDELDPSIRVELAAPTGKAAKRLKQATGRDARTVHRLLDFKPGRGFGRNHESPIDAQLVVVDEASMLDIELGAALFEAIRPDARLVLVGDVDQLPPVGPGQPFADLIRSELVPVARLNRLHRAATTSWVARNAQRVLGKQPLELDEHKDFRFVRAAGALEVLPRVRDEIEYLRAREETNSEPQVLIPQTTGAAGVDAANLVLQDVFNPKRPDVDYSKAHYIQRDKCTIREGDRVIQTKNDYELGVFNGDVGEVITIEAGKVAVHMIDDAREVTYRIDQTNSLRLAYALTIHRSQGSEFPWVVCVIHSTHTFMLTRQLLYTAITRAKKGVVIVGDERGIDTALREGRVPERNTTLIERLTGNLEEITVEHA